MCIYLTLPYLPTNTENSKVSRWGARRNFPAELFIMHTVSLSEASLSLFMDDEKHVQYITRNGTYLPT